MLSEFMQQLFRSDEQRKCRKKHDGNMFVKTFQNIFR
jgi:hypothetical protein